MATNLKKIDNDYTADIDGITTESGIVSNMLLNNQRSGYTLAHDINNSNVIGYNTSMIFSSNKVTNMALNSKSIATGFVTYLSSDNSVGYSTILSTSGTNISASLPILAATGTVFLPAYSFTNDSNTGIYSVGSDDLGISTNGTLRFNINTAAITASLPFYISDGTAEAPAYSFLSDTNTGIYRIGSDSIGISTGGTLKLNITSTIFSSTIPFYTPTGTAEAPSYSFSGDTNTGIYRIGSDSIGISTGGTLRMTIASDLTTIANHVTYSNRQYIRLRNTTAQSISYNTSTALTFSTIDDSEGAGFTFTSNSIFTNTSGYAKYYIVRIFTRHNGTTNTVNYHTLLTNNGSDDIINNYRSSIHHRGTTTFQVKLNNNGYMAAYFNHLQTPGPITVGTTTAGVDQTRFVIIEMS